MRTLFIPLLLLCLSASAQNKVDITNSDVTVNTSFFQVVAGTPVTPTTFYKVVEGTAFFNDYWMRGSVSIDRVKEYKNLILKINLMEGMLHFRDIKGEEMICNNAIAIVKLVDSVTGGTYTFVHTSTIPAFAKMKPPTWMEMLADGEAQLYYHRRKSIQESRPYGSATVEHRIITGDFYYVVIGDQSIRVKKLQEVIDALPSKKQEVQQWVSSNNIPKNAQGFAKVIEYYNTLAKN
ncbi:MAG TPA: hypothetical protein VFZ47_10390 [Chitinophagaceae bacterium]